MKAVFAVLAAAVAIAPFAATDASAEQRGYRKANVKHTGARFYGRAHSVDHNGLYKRDTGTPSGDLNFRNKGDTDEYWARVFENGRRR